MTRGYRKRDEDRRDRGARTTGGKNCRYHQAREGGVVYVRYRVYYCVVEKRKDFACESPLMIDSGMVAPEPR